MITEDYVSFETAKLLKGNGFDDFTCHSYYYKNGDIEEETRYEGDFGRPTIQMAMKWLRKAHNLCIEPYRTACGYLYTISTIPYGSCKCNPKEGGDDEDSGQWTSYEGACEAAIKYCLENLI